MTELYLVRHAQQISALGTHEQVLADSIQSLIHVTHTGIFCWRRLELGSIPLCGWDLLYANDTHHLDGL